MAAGTTRPRSWSARNTRSGNRGPGRSCRPLATGISPSTSRCLSCGKRLGKTLCATRTVSQGKGLDDDLRRERTAFANRVRAAGLAYWLRGWILTYGVVAVGCAVADAGQTCLRCAGRASVACLHAGRLSADLLRVVAAGRNRVAAAADGAFLAAKAPRAFRRRTGEHADGRACGTDAAGTR